MAFIVISADQSTPIAPAAGDIIIIEADATVTSPSDGVQGFTVSNLIAVVNGTLAGNDNGGEFGGGASITIGATGTALGKSCGIWLNGSGSVLSNAGTIQSLGDGSSFIEAAIALNNASNNLLSNTGTISGRGIGIDYTASTGTVLDNTGEIAALLDAITGQGGISITNTGSITSGTATAIDLSSTATAGLKLFNAGIIQAPVLAINGTGVLDIVRNVGTVDGNVSLGAGDDRFINSGDVFGNLDLGDGADRYAGRDGGSVDGLIGGGTGNDTLTGGSGGDRIDGGSGLDVLRGNAGDDSLSGGINADTLIGGDGDDLLDGGGAFDRFVFRRDFGDDTIAGFSTDDAEKIDIRSVSTIVSFADLVNNHLTQVGADSVIADGAGNTITLLGILTTNLSAGDFIF